MADTIKKQQTDYYDGGPILGLNAQLNIIYSDRQNGKTYYVLRWCIEQWWKKGRQTYYLRRWREFFKMTRNVDTLFDGLIENDEIKKITKGRYTSVVRKGQMWYLAAKTTDSKGKTQWSTQEDPFMIGGSFTETENLKSGATFPKASILVFDEFIATGGVYYPNELALFETQLSSIKRDKPDKDFTIIMLGNALTAHGCPYFRHYGIRKAAEQEIGTIRVYRVPVRNTGRTYTFAVERAPLALHKTKILDDYFLAFDSPTARMTSEGAFAIDKYPLIDDTYDEITRHNICFVFYVHFDDEDIQCDVVKDTNGVYVFCHKISHRKRLDYKKDLIYTDAHSIRRNIRSPWTLCLDKVDKKINSLYVRGNFVYDDNETGDLIATFLNVWNDIV